MQLIRIIYNFSVKFLCLFSHGRGDHLAVNSFNLGDSLYDMRSHFILRLFTIDGVAVEEDVLDFGELSNLGDLIESLDLVVADLQD